MNYIGKLYGKIGRQYIPIKLDSADVDKLEADNNELREIVYDLKDALEMVRDADEDSKLDGLQRWCTDVARARIDKAIAKATGKDDL